MFTLSTNKKNEKRLHDLLPLPLEHLLNQSDQSSHLTQTDSLMLCCHLRLTFITHLRPEVLILHVCSRVARYSNIIIHFNWKANKRDTYGTICSNTVHEAVMRLSVVSNVTLHSLAFLFGSNWTGRIISFYENIKIKTRVPTCLGGHKPCSTSPVNDIPGLS